MKFIDPSLKEVYKVISGNKELIEYLTNENILLTKEQFYGIKSENEIKDLDIYIYKENIKKLYDVAQALLNNEESIKNKDLWEICNKEIAYKEIANSFGITEKDFNQEAYKKIIYTYKYCFVSSFFQNNKDKFFTEIDLEEIEKNDSLNAFTDAMLKEFDKFDDIISKCSEYRDFDKIPQDLINYLSQLLGFEKSNLNIEEKDEERYREIVKSMVDLYRVKGTNYSFEVFFKFLGYNITISEFYFDRRLLYSPKGNPFLNVKDINNYKYYLIPYNPSDNNLDITISEYVDHRDFTPQYSLNEFNDLSEEFGVEAVLGYSDYDKHGNEYTGKVYKYFKTNSVYYSVSTEKRNPTDKEIAAINKILSFLTPAYINRTTDVKINTDIAQNSVADNIIFFDRTVDIEGMENKISGNDKNIEAERRKIRDFIRDTYPIMLDSEIRDSNEGSKIFTTIKIDDNGDAYLGITHDDGSEEKYYNSSNNIDYKEKIPVKIRDGNNNPFLINLNTNKNIITSQLSEIKKFLDKSKFNKSIDIFTNKTIEDYFNNDTDFNKLLYEVSYIDTLWLRSRVYKKATSETLNDVIKEEYNLLNKKYDLKNDINNIIERNTDSEIINPFSLDKEMLKTLKEGDRILCKYIRKESDIIVGVDFLIYSYGALTAASDLYKESYDLKLIQSNSFALGNGALKVNANIIESGSLDSLYNKIKDDKIKETNNIYYSSDNANWYYSIKKANVKKNENTVANYKVLPELENNKDYPIRIVYKNKNGFHLNKPEEADIGKEKIFDLFKENNIEYYSNYMFYIEDCDNIYDSDLYKVIYANKNYGKIIYSTADSKLYITDGSSKGYSEIKETDGEIRFEDEKYKIFRFDELYQGYDEKDERDNYILYNNSHNIVWKEVGIDGYNHIYVYQKNGDFYSDKECTIKAIIPEGVKPNFVRDNKYEYKNGKNSYSRPIRSFTDKMFIEDVSLMGKVEKYIFDNSFSLLNSSFKLDILSNDLFKTKNYSKKIKAKFSYITEYELYNLFLTNEITQDQVDFILNTLNDTKYKMKDLDNEVYEDDETENKGIRRNKYSYGDKYPNPYFMFLDYIKKSLNDQGKYTVENKETFIKEFFYTVMLEKWRSSGVREEETLSSDNNQNVFDEFNNSYELLNGKAGNLYNLNTLNNYYKKESNTEYKTSYNVEFSDLKFENFLWNFYVKKTKITCNINNLLTARPIFDNMLYSYDTYKVSKILEKGEYYIITLEGFEKNDNLLSHSNTGYFEFNKIEQRLIDNIINHPIDAYNNFNYKKIFMYSNGDGNFYKDKNLKDPIDLPMDANPIKAYEVSSNLYLYICNIKEYKKQLLKSNNIGIEWGNNGDDRNIKVESISNVETKCDINYFTVPQEVVEYDIEFIES